MSLNVDLIPAFLNAEDASKLFRELMALPFYTPVFKIRMRNCQPQRKVYAFSDDGVSYSFSGCTINGNPWTDAVMELKKKIEAHIGASYNFCLLNFYENGSSTISAHRDDESSLAVGVPIPTLSLGSTRTVLFSSEASSTSYTLVHGSLYIMREPTNKHYKHSIASEPEVMEPRISLSFRKINESRKRPREEEPVKVDLLYEKMMMDLDSKVLKVDMEYLDYFPLGKGCKIEIMRKNHRLRIQISKKVSSSNGPVTRSIQMTAETWNDFMSKISEIDCKRKTTSFIAFNQLAVIATGEAIQLQQIYHGLAAYEMRPSSVELDMEEIDVLRETFSDVLKVLMEGTFRNILPELFLAGKFPCGKSDHDSLECTKESIFEYISIGLKKTISENLFCVGCKVNHPSQTRHDCLILSEVSKYEKAGGETLIN